MFGGVCVCVCVGGGGGGVEAGVSEDGVCRGVGGWVVMEQCSCFTMKQ